MGCKTQEVKVSQHGTKPLTDGTKTNVKLNLDKAEVLLVNGLTI